MAKEYEIVSNAQFRFLNVFLVKINSRAQHIHSEIELGVVLDGNTTLRKNSDTFELTKGDIYLINSMEAHEFISDSEGVLILSIQISMRLLESFLSEQPVLRFTSSPRLKDVLGENEYDILTLLCSELAFSYLSDNSSSVYSYKCFGLTAQLLYFIKKWIPNESIKQQDYLPMKQKTDRLLSILNYIDENYTFKLLLSDIAEREGLSATYLSHLFKDALGMSFQDYLMNKRFEHAVNLLATTQRRILDISIACGFSDVRYLTKMFQTRFGCTPKEYRKGTQGLKKNAQPALSSIEHHYDQKQSLSIISSFREDIKQMVQMLPVETIWL